MMTVNEVSKLTGISIRMLHHYDEIGLLPATKITESKYRLYDEKAIERLQMIMLFKELEFPLKEIVDIIDSPDFDKEKAIEEQIKLLEFKKERLDNIINFARGINKMNKTNFDVFNSKKIDEYKKKAKVKYGHTDAYREYESRKTSNINEQELGVKLMDIFSEFGEIKNESSSSDKAQTLVKKLQDFITQNYYVCTDVLLESLGKMYSTDGEIKDNIDNYAGKGTAVFVSEAIKAKISGGIS